MKKIFLLLITCMLLLSVNLFAQNTKYTTHILTQGETLSMLAEKYKTTVGDIMRLNGMHADTKLSVGQKLKIPGRGQIVERNGETKPTPGPVNNTKPVVPAPPVKANASGALTHTVVPKETMYGISKKYGVTIEQIKQWNNMPDNNLEIGQVIAVNSKGIAEAAAKRKEQIETGAKVITAVPDQTPPLVVKETIRIDEPAKENVVQKTEEKKQEVNIVPETKEKVRPSTNAAADGSDNFFNKNFTEAAPGKSLSDKNGTAMIFKTASGWSDRKYYVLMNEAPSGSIVKISASNGNIVYAKVLWKLDEMKENKGLQFRISEAAAAALNVQGDKFLLTIQYYQ